MLRESVSVEEWKASGKGIECLLVFQSGHQPLGTLVGECGGIVLFLLHSTVSIVVMPLSLLIVHHLYVGTLLMPFYGNASSFLAVSSAYIVISRITRASSQGM